MVYIRLYNSLDMIIDEVEVNKGDSIMDTIVKTNWHLEAGDKIVIAQEDE